MNERGLTIQTVIISAVMALIAAVAGIVIYNIVADESEDIEEIVEEVSDITLFTEDGEEEPDEEPDEEEPDPDEEPDEEEPGECPEGEERNDQGECEIEECTATQLRNDQGECEEVTSTGLPVKALSSGQEYTCTIIGASSVDAKDAVWCWGTNRYSQLGEATGEVASIPVKIPGLENVRALSVGESSACVIVRESEFSSVADTVKCWGENDNSKTGQIKSQHDPNSLRGNPRLIIREEIKRPESVPELTGVQAISVGKDHVCVIAANPLHTGEKTVECWGNGDSGALGAEQADIPTSKTIFGPSFPGGETAIRVLPRNTVTELSGKDLKAIAAGDGFTCVIVGGDQPDGSADTVWCWGDNTYEQLGIDSSTEYSIAPIEIAGLTGAKAITTGAGHACAIIGGDQPDGSADTVWCWGNNDFGQLGNDEGGDSHPVEISDFEGAKSVVAKYWTTCIITFTNSYKCIGQVARDGADDGASQPAVSFIAPGLNHVCITYTDDDGILDDSVSCFGDNSKLQIGRDTSLAIPYHIPNKIKESSGAKRVSVGENIGCFITSSDTLKCWGSNQYEQLDFPIKQVNNYITVPQEIPIERNGAPLSGVTDISNSSLSAYCVIASKSAQISEKVIKCRGRNFFGALGVDPSVSTRLTSFANITQVLNPVAVSNYHDHTCAISDGNDLNSFADNTIWCWGDSWDGQIIPFQRQFDNRIGYIAPAVGRGTFEDSDDRGPVSPQLLEDLKNNRPPVPITGAKAISAGGAHTCAIAAELDLTGSGSSFTGTLTGKDTVWCWGRNYYGQLGLPYLLDNAWSYFPRQIPGLNGAKAISAGHSYTCIITAEDTVKCWGRNNWGQLGTARSGRVNARDPIPFMDPGLKRVTAISAGIATTCAVAAVLDGANEPTTEDAVYCWGENFYGLAGLTYSALDIPEKVPYSTTPVRIQGIIAPVDVSVGDNQVCAIAADLDGDNNPTGEDVIYCWGGFDFGARGTLHIPGTDILYWEANSYSEPQQISGL